MKRVSSSVTLLLRVVVLLLLSEGTRFCFGGMSRLGCIEEEREALLKLKQSFTDPSNRLVSWSGEDCCRWRGVGCNASTGRVVKLDLSRPKTAVFLYDEMRRLTELSAIEVHPSLAELKQLEYVDLSWNNFQQSQIPEFVGSLKHLRYLNLSGAGFVGRLPRQLGNLTELQVLDLRYALRYGEDNDLRWVSSLSSLRYLDLSGGILNTAPAPMRLLSKLPSLTHLSLQNCGIQISQLSHSSINSTFLARIEYLDLSSNSIEGPVPEYLGNMTALRYLDISSNRFNSTFPLGLGKLRGLEYLSLARNSFSGPIPSSIAELSLLWSVDLSQNQLSGPIPFSLSELSRLRSLDLSGNQLSGSIPQWLGSLSAMESLSLLDNQLSGEIPRSLMNLSSLSSLYLSNNKLSGAIPEELGSLSALELLSLSSNLLNGGIPQSFGRFPQLLMLDLSHNQLNGTVPQVLWNMSSLGWLYLSNNRLRGTVLESLRGVSHLWYLDVSHNQFSQVSESLGQLVDVLHLDISCNPLEGVISELHLANLPNMTYLDISSINLIWKVNPDWIPPFRLSYLNMSSLRIGPRFPQWLKKQRLINTLDLSKSNISGDFSLLPLSPNLFYLDISENRITGSLRAHIAATMPSISALFLGNNMMNGSIPNSICDLESLEVLDISKNMISGEIPNCWREFNQVSVINLSSNKLSGTIPSSLGNLFVLKWLHLDGNNLSGQLPSTMRSCTSLELLDVGENKISGVIPDWVGESLLSLKILRLRKNMFGGDISPELCRLLEMQILDLALNNFSGGIPSCLGKLKGMTTDIFEVTLSSSPGAPAPAKSIIEPPNTPAEPPAIETAYAPQTEGPAVGEEQWHKEKVSVFTKGTLLDYTTTLLLLDGLDLSSNNLEGPIPEELCGLTGLRTLNLSRNRLMGNIPNQIGNFKSLESFDLSHNRLSGQIPQAMSMLTSLNHLNLSYNNLSGKIPTGNQLQTLDDPSIYTGNLQLCGPPLTKKCDGDEEPAKAPTSSDNGNGDPGEDTRDTILFWFIVTSGYAIGLWTVIAVLVLNKKWRIAYFGFVDNTKERILAVVAVIVARLKQRIQRTEAKE